MFFLGEIPDSINMPGRLKERKRGGTGRVNTRQRRGSPGGLQA